MGWLIPRAQKQKRAVEWVRSHGGQVFYRFQTDQDCEPVSGTSPPGPKFLRDLIGIDYFASVDVVYLNKQPVSDLSQIEPLSRLRLLQLSNHDGELADISSLANLANLESLYLAHYPIADISSLRALKRLRSFTAFATDISDIAVLGSLPRLEEVSLRNCQISDDDILRLQDLRPELKIQR